MKTSIKRIIFDNEYLKANYKNLLSLSKRNNILVLVFKNPLKLFYIQIESKPHTASTKCISIMSVH